MNLPMDFIVAETGRVRDAGWPSRNPPARSRSAHFVDREQASIELVQRLVHLRHTSPLVLASPPGGAPIAREIADKLDGDLDVVLVRSLERCDLSGDLAGAVDEYGTIHLIGSGVDTGVEQTRLQREAQRQLDRIRLQRERYIRLRVPLDPAGRVVIVVDDGLSKPTSIWAALASVWCRKPMRLVCALPALPPEGIPALTKLADEVICVTRLSSAQDFSDLYERVDTVADERVASLITQSDRMLRSGKDPSLAAQILSGSDRQRAEASDVRNLMDREH